MIFPPVHQLQAQPSPGLFIPFDSMPTLQALVTQTGTGDLTVNTLVNSIGAFTSVSRLGVGIYEIACTGKFPPGATVAVGSLTDWSSMSAVVCGVDISGNKLILLTYDITNPASPVLADGKLSSNPLLVYTV